VDRTRSTASVPYAMEQPALCEVNLNPLERPVVDLSL
jgi:hypothetical protein